MNNLSLVQFVAPDVDTLVSPSESPHRSDRLPQRYLERSSHGRPRPGVHLAVYEIENADETVHSLGWEWSTGMPWEEGSLWQHSDGRPGGMLLLMWACSAESWKLMWSEQSGHVIATAFAQELDELLGWWGRDRVALVRRPLEQLDGLTSDQRALMRRLRRENRLRDIPP